MTRIATLAVPILLLAGCAGMQAPGDQVVAPFSAPTTVPGLVVRPPVATAFTSSMSGITALVITDPLTPRTIDLITPADDVWQRIRNGFAVPNIDTPLVKQQQDWYLARNDYFMRTVERSGRYLYYIVDQLEKRGMPTELALLPFIESAYNPMAYSRAHASGMWQFIPSTGKNYNLKQDWWRDERRDVVASTEAALSYLQAIYDMHGDWHLALASYNWGEGSVKRAIEKNRAAGKPTDYLSLNMPDETRNYIPKLQAVKNIIAHPELYGINLPKVDNQPYFAAVTRKRDMDMRTAARMAEMPLDEFRALNPSFNRPIIPGASGPALLLPTDKVSIFESNLESQEQPLVSWQSYRMQRGERLDRVAAKFGMSLAMLREVNGIGPGTRITAGQALLVQRRVGGSSTAAPVDAQGLDASAPMLVSLEQPAPSSSGSRSHVVARGETLASIAQKYGVATDALARFNNLRGHIVKVGQTLKIPGAAAVRKPTTRAPHASVNVKRRAPAPVKARARRTTS